jgi:hypothetical protein
LKLSSGRDPVRARTSPGCPRLAGKPRTSSLVVDQEMNNMELEGEEKRGKRSILIYLYDDWIDGNSIGHYPLIYIEEGGLIPVGNLSKAYFLSFPRPKTDLEINRFEI